MAATPISFRSSSKDAGTRLGAVFQKGALKSELCQLPPSGRAIVASAAEGEVAETSDKRTLGALTAGFRLTAALPVTEA
jgi:hypothetical protein